MSAEAITYALLSADAAVLAIVGSAAGIYPTELPEDKPAPALAYRLVSSQGADDVSLQQPMHLITARVQVDAITSRDAFAQRKALLLAVRRAMHGTVGVVAGCTGVTVRAVGEGPDLQYTRAGLASGSHDFFITYHQAT